MNVQDSVPSGGVHAGGANFFNLSIQIGQSQIIDGKIASKCEMC